MQCRNRPSILKSSALSTSPSFSFFWFPHFSYNENEMTTDRNRHAKVKITHWMWLLISAHRTPHTAHHRNRFSSNAKMCNTLLYVMYNETIFLVALFAYLQVILYYVQHREMFCNQGITAFYVCVFEKGSSIVVSIFHADQWTVDTAINIRLTLSVDQIYILSATLYRLHTCINTKTSIIISLHLLSCLAIPQFILITTKQR